MKNPKLIHTFEDGRTLYLCDPEGGILLGAGPHLFVDNYLIESAAGVRRLVPQPARARTVLILGSTLASDGFENFNFCSPVCRDPVSGQYRMWYTARDPISGGQRSATTVSDNGINWGPPEWLPTLSTQLISCVLDEGPDYDISDQRYKTILGSIGSPPRWSGELWTSPDGVSWSRHSQNPVVSNKYGEMWTLFKNGGGYGLLHRHNIGNFAWTDAEGVSRLNTIHDPTFVRTLAVTSSPTGLGYPASSPAFLPSAARGDSGEMQFYNVSNIVQRGGLLLGMLNVLRDDLTASGVPAGAYGQGYTVLCWSRDGITWGRHSGGDPHFLDPASAVDAFDHAHAWVTAIVPVDDDVYLYYGGYGQGHKVYTDRSIGLVAIRRDRYVARTGGAAPVVLRTNPVQLGVTGGLAINSSGKVRVQITDEAGVPLPGFRYADCGVLTADRLDAPLVSAGSLASLAGRTVKLEFELTNAKLYGFYLSP